MEQGLYAQVVMICRKYYHNKKEKGEDKKIQGQSEISIHQFDLDHKWSDDNFKTWKTDLYRTILNKYYG